MRILSVFLLVGCGLATADTFLIKSTDGGRTWTDIDPGPPHQLLASLNIGTSALYAMTRRDYGSEGRLLVSSDGGQTWQTRQSFPPAVWNILAAVSSDTLYLAYEDGVGYPRSAIITKVTDGGQTVEQYRAEGLTIVQGTVPNSLGGLLARFAADPATPSRLYALITNELNDDLFKYFQALWVSTDGGRNWKRLEPPVSYNCTYPGIWVTRLDSSVYLACGTDFLQSSNGGESWMRKLIPDGGRIWDLQIGPGAPAILYTVSGNTLWRSTDGAETWRRSGELPPGLNLNVLQAHPTNPSVIFGVGSNGIWKSENGGETWTTLLEQQWSGIWFRIQVDPRAPNTLYGVGPERQEVRIVNDRQTFLRSLSGEKQIAPGSLVSIYGRDLARETRVAGSIPLPVSLGGASVFFNGQPAPLLFVSPGQINAQVPFGLAAETRAYPQTTSVVMEVRRPDASLDRQIVSLSPRAVFVLREDQTRQSAPLLFHASDFARVSADNPIRRGEAVTLFALGMGDLEPSLAAGEPPPTPPPQLVSPACVSFSTCLRCGSVLPTAAPLWAGAAPGLIGLYQVNVEVPASLSPGPYWLSLTASDRSRCGFWGGDYLYLDSFPIEVQ